MEFKVIFFSMAATLAALFIFTHFYRKKENQLTKLEVSYFEKVKASRNNPSHKGQYEQAVQAAKDYALKRGLSQQDLDKMIAQDLLDSPLGHES